MGTNTRKRFTSQYTNDLRKRGLQQFRNQHRNKNIADTDANSKVEDTFLTVAVAIMVFLVVASHQCRQRNSRHETYLSHQKAHCHIVL